MSVQHVPRSIYGHHVSENGIDPTEERVLDPETQSKVRSFLV
jgi:hypothetical protein